MSTKMNSKTHKIITATYYPAERHFVVPIDWEIDDISIKYDHVYYKKEFQEAPVYEMETDEKYPEKIEEGDWEDLAGYFSCCESEEEEEEECDDCEGKCRADETEKCDNCAVELRIGCGNKPSDHSIFNGLCDDCREEEEEEEEEECAECCRCGEDVSNDEGDGKQVDGEYWCVDCVEDAHQCELCKKHVQETEYLPSKEDEEKQQILGNDYCLECYKKVEKFEFVENIDLDK